MGVLRAYENGKPAKTPDFLKFNFAGPAAGEAVFVLGPSRLHRSPADAGAAQTAAQSRAAAVAAALSRKSAGASSSSRRRAPRTSASRPTCSTASRTSSRCVARWSMRCTRTRCSRARPRKKTRCASSSPRMPSFARPPAIRGATSKSALAVERGAVRAVHLHRRRRGFPGPPGHLRAHAGARRRRARQAELAALPRIHRRRAAAHRAAAGRARARLLRSSKSSAPRQRPRAHARVARARSSRGAQAACRRNRPRRSPSGW